MFQHYLVYEKTLSDLLTVCLPGTEGQATKREGPNNGRPSGWCCGASLTKSLPYNYSCTLTLTSGGLFIEPVHLWF